MELDEKMIAELIKGVQEPRGSDHQNGLLKQLIKRLVEAELTGQLGYSKHERVLEAAGNARNGSTPKKLKGDFGEIEIETPRRRVPRKGSTGSGSRAGCSSANIAATCRLVVPRMRVSAQWASK